MNSARAVWLGPAETQPRERLQLLLLAKVGIQFPVAAAMKLYYYRGPGDLEETHTGSGDRKAVVREWNPYTSITTSYKLTHTRTRTRGRAYSLTH